MLSMFLGSVRFRSEADVTGRLLSAKKEHSPLAHLISRLVVKSFDVQVIPKCFTFKPEDVRRAFPEGIFRKPATAAAIAQAEHELGHSLPDQLRNLYLEFDGFQGPTGANFLFPVFEWAGPNSESLLTYTQFFRGEDYFPDWLEHAVALGDNGTGTTWFVLLNQGERLVRWDAEWEEYKHVDGSLLDAWVAGRKIYESIYPNL
jgi:hypothetical protein